MSDALSATSPLSIGGHSHTNDDEETVADGINCSTPLSAPQSPTDAKLFIGQIPRHIGESDIRRLFEPYGDIQQLVILRDKHTNTHKGCAFLTYAARSSADRAISAVHEKLSLHNRPIVVRFAGIDNAPTECKLFVGMLSRETSEESIHSLFSSFGVVKEVFVMRNGHHQSKGCAFVKMTSREDALTAITELNDVYQDDGAPRKLVVRFADSKANKAANQAERAVHLIPQHSHPHMVMSPWPQPWPYPYYRSSIPPPPPPPHQRYPQQMSSPTFHPYFALNNVSPQHNDMYNAHATMSAAQAHAHAAAAAFHSQQYYDHSAPSPHSAQQQLPRGPPGSNLFVYNIPDTFIDVDLHHLFSAFGGVLSTKVYRDKSSGLSRGFGFVSFAEPNSAEKAIQALNGFTVANKRLKVMYKKGTDNANANGQTLNVNANVNGNSNGNGNGTANGNINGIQYQTHGMLNGIATHNNTTTTTAPVTRMTNSSHYY